MPKMEDTAKVIRGLIVLAACAAGLLKFLNPQPRSEAPRNVESHGSRSDSGGRGSVGGGVSGDRTGPGLTPGPGLANKWNSTGSGLFKSPEPIPPKLKPGELMPPGWRDNR